MTVNIDKLNALTESEFFELSFGERLRIVRTKRGFTLNELERISGVSRSLISAYELGNNDPGLFNLKCLCDSLKVKASVLLGF